MRHSFVFDQNKCTGCHACRLACTIENELPLQESWRQIYTFNPERLPVAPVFHLSLACNHCADPACLSACPALAYAKDPTTGAVLLDERKCIGCQYCSWACPYDAPQFDHSRGVMTKCTFCIERLREGLSPACVDLCPTGALQYGCLPEDQLGNDAEGFPPSALGPAIQIVPWNDRRVMHPHGASALPPTTARHATRVGLRSEWPLLAFTFIVATLFGSVAAQVVGGVGVSPVTFVVVAALGLTVSAAHLGVKSRAWRAILNVRQSWLSREVVAVTLFVASASAYLALMSDRTLVGWMVIVLGLAALFSVDMVYRFGIRPGPRIPHSASLVLTGPLLAGVLLLDPAFGVLFGVTKVALYLWRKVGFARTGYPWRPWTSGLRLVVGAALPAVLWMVDAGGLQGLLVLGVLVGEFVDRAEFYEELDLRSPQRQMEIDLGRRAEAAIPQPSSR